MAEKLSVSFEFFPPSSEAAEARLWNTVEKLAPLGPAFASVTYGAGGTTRERTLKVVQKLKNDGRMEPAAHLTCVGADKAEIDGIARGWLEAGISRLVALRGDPPQDTGRYQPHPNGYQNAADPDCVRSETSTFPSRPIRRRILTPRQRWRISPISRRRSIMVPTARSPSISSMSICSCVFGTRSRRRALMHRWCRVSCRLAISAGW